MILSFKKSMPVVQSRVKKRKSGVRIKTIAKTKTIAKQKSKDLSASYNQFKQFGVKQYSGMKVGRSHHWHYDQGDWKETKITPDLWEIYYSVTKRRVGHAPAGSGVPIGTGYHWYILAHQNVAKLNANDYSTTLAGLKFKIAHKRADKGKWSASAAGQRKRMIDFLREMIAQLERDPIPLNFTYNDTEYKGEAIAVGATCHDKICEEHEVTLNNENMGIIRCMKSGWKMDGQEDKGFIKALGQEILVWYK
jgi:hypothetical protein